MIADTARIYPQVQLGRDVVIEDYCVIGCPGQDGQEPTVIGDGARIRSHTVIYSGNKIGKGFVTGNHVNIREHNVIGNHVSVGTSSVIEHHVVIEDGVRIHSQAFIPEYSTLKTLCWIGPQAVLTNVKFPLSADAKKTLKGPTIEAKAKIGAHATILPGITVGENALIGAGSVVTKDVPAQVICAGNPARILRAMPY